MGKSTYSAGSVKFDTRYYSILTRIHRFGLVSHLTVTKWEIHTERDHSLLFIDISIFFRPSLDGEDLRCGLRQPQYYLNSSPTHRFHQSPKSLYLRSPDNLLVYRYRAFSGPGMRPALPYSYISLWEKFLMGTGPDGSLIERECKM